MKTPHLYKSLILSLFLIFPFSFSTANAETPETYECSRYNSTTKLYPGHPPSSCKDYCKNARKCIAICKNLKEGLHHLKKACDLSKIQEIKAQKN